MLIPHHSPQAHTFDDGGQAIGEEIMLTYTAAPILVGGKRRLFACTLCTYKATKISNLQRHLRSHTGERPFACTLCPYATARKIHLETHMRTHTGEKPFSCPHCHFCSNDKSNLRRHIKKHQKIKYFCMYCPHQSKSPELLKSHVELLHPVTGDHFQ
ncbi:hypothetical protein SK128_005432 [Halocaridina rubra]|uniref:C2H2-type domain-containing protein n=1 Tax=Halocaridina rubra TaxID=373956 RepID=A0AAN8XRX4_HALRR